MPNIKEIALKVADKSGAVAYSPAPLRAVRGYSFTFEQLQNFAEALVAEIQRESEPVEFQAREIGEGESWYKVGLAEVERIKSIIDCPRTDYRWLFTFPPDKAKIEQSVAEACAKWCASEATKAFKEQAEDWGRSAVFCAEAIRSGAWKEFKQS